MSSLNFIVRHPINRGRPLSAVGRFLRWQIVSRLQREVAFSWIGGSKLIVRRGMTGATGNIYCGLHEYVDMSFVLHVLRPGDLFLDVGANIGSYTILASAVCGADCVSIEPDPTTASHLVRNIAVNNREAQCTVIQTAVGAEEGTVSFTLGKDTVNQVARESDEATQVVPLSRLDTLIKVRVPAVLKMDVEGYELEALAGAERLMSNMYLKAIIIENTSSDVVSVLESHGFNQYFYEPVSRQLSKIDFGIPISNGIFVRDIEWVKSRSVEAPSRVVFGRPV